MISTRKEFIKKSALGLAGVASASSVSSWGLNFNIRKANPDEWPETTPESQGVNAEKLNEAVQYLIDNSGSDGADKLVIVRNNAIIWRGTDIDEMHSVWSITKSFTGTVLGMLIDDGKLGIDAKASRYLPELSETYPDITLRHFVTMTSGYCAEGDNPERSHGQSPTPFIPALNPLFTPPGSKFAYWDSATNQFAHVLTRIAGEPLEEFFRRRIADPIGMNRQKWEWRGWEKDDIKICGGAGNQQMGIYISARELVKFGQLFLNRGKWNGRQLISSRWVESATSVQVPVTMPVAFTGIASTAPGTFGYFWWVNGYGMDHRKWPDAPSGTFAASGFNNNRLFIIPEREMVIVRMGLDQSDVRMTDETGNVFLQKVNDAVIS